MAPLLLCHQLSPRLPASSPARLLPLLPFLVFIISEAIYSTAGALPQGSPVETKSDEEKENQYLPKPALYDPPQHDSEKSHLGNEGAFTNGRNDCYALEFSKNMSTLLSEASHMLERVKNSRERNWLKAFIRRLTSLADDLLEHPQVRKSGCLWGEKTRKIPEKELRQSQKKFDAKSKNMVPEDHVLPQHKPTPVRSHITEHVTVGNPSLTTGKILSQNQLTVVTKAESNQRDFVTEEMSNIDGGSKLDNNDDLVQQLRIGPPGVTDSTIPQAGHPHGMIDVKVWKTPKSLHDQSNISSSKRGVTNSQPSTLKGEALQKLLGEMTSQVQKLKELGGTEEDILNLWNENGPKTPLPTVEVTPSPEEEQDIPDFYEEQGAATGELRLDDNQQDLIVEPSINKIVSTLSSSGLGTIDDSNPTPKPTLEGQVNDEDDLVRQLQEEKFLSEAGPMSLSADQESVREDAESNMPSKGVPYKRIDIPPMFG